jgi:NAD-dependent SIR2 family protein deacetylase
MAGALSSLDPAAIAIAAELVATAGALVIATGAGMGVDSGLPDFRGNAGSWHAYPALGARGLDFAAIASARSFEKAARLAWSFYGHRLALCRQTTPHAASPAPRAPAQSKSAVQHAGCSAPDPRRPAVQGQLHRLGASA